MKVSELIEKLQGLDPDTTVVGANVRDYQAPTYSPTIDEVVLSYRDKFMDDSILYVSEFTKNHRDGTIEEPNKVKVVILK